MHALTRQPHLCATASRETKTISGKGQRNLQTLDSDQRKGKQERVNLEELEEREKNTGGICERKS